MSNFDGWTYIAQRPMRVGDREYQPGDVLPDEFASRPGVDAELSMGRCIRVPRIALERAELVPLAPAAATEPAAKRDTKGATASETAETAEATEAEVEAEGTTRRSRQRPRTAAPQE